MTRVAVVGLGYWGPNLVRALTSVPDAQVAALADVDVARARAAAERLCPGARVVQDCRELLGDPGIDAVAIATPIHSHFTLASAFLAAGQHVFIEKPLARTAAECRTLIEVAKAHRRVLMVDHVFQYNAAVQRIKQYVDGGELGRLLYMCSQRVNLGRIQTDINALWSFAPHDVSIMNYWLGQEPVRVAARGFSYLTAGVEDVVFVVLDYPGGMRAHLHLSWLDPRKLRVMTLVGSRRMLVYDDVSADAKIRLYDKGIVQFDEYLAAPAAFPEFQFRLRDGDVLTPPLVFPEPLQAACRHFIDCVHSGRSPLTDGETGLRVVRVLEAAEQSLKQDGAAVDLQAASMAPVS
jgi:predicted dehydrogenase